MSFDDPEARAAAIDALLEEEAIKKVIRRFCHSADRLDRDAVLSCFHPDATDNHGFFNGPAHEFYNRRAAGWMPLAMHHALGQMVIELHGDVALTESYCSATVVYEGDDGPQTHYEAVRYLDRFEKRDGEWKIARRFVAFDAAVTVPGGLPDRYPQENWGTRDEHDPWYLFMSRERV